MRTQAVATGRRSTPSRRGVRAIRCGGKSNLAAKAELTAAIGREQKLLGDKNELLQRQDMLTQKFEHRLVNS